MPASPPLPMPTSHLLGLVLVALWLGWTVSALAALATPGRADAAALASLAARLAPATGQAQAIRLPGCACAAAGSDGNWQGVAQVLRQAGGQARSASLASDYELLVFDREGRMVYAGPLQPPASACGRHATEAGDWLPALLDGTQPPLLLSPSCSCRD